MASRGRPEETVRTVFLSSTGADLREYRGAAFDALQKLDDWKCVRMENFGARDWDVDEFCREQVKACDLFIGIIGHRFGDAPKGIKESYTQREYQAAVEADVPRLLFLAPDDIKVPPNLWEPQWKMRTQAKFRKNLDRIASEDFTTPDQLATQILTAIRHWEREAPARRQADPGPYLEALWEDTAHIDIRGLRVSNEAVYRFRIDELYTPLTTVLAPDERKKERAELAPEHRAVPLQQALASRRLVLVGDPGAGKSTFLRRIAFAACETLLGRNPAAAKELLHTDSCPFPVLIRAASLANYIRQHQTAAACPAETDSPEWLIHYLHSSAQERNWDLDGAFFRGKLSAAGLLMLDGLDEVPGQARRKAIARLLESAARAYPTAQMVATSRPPAYGGETLIPGFTTIQIAPLDDQAVATFVENWCRLLYQGGDKAGEHQGELLDAINSKPEIRELAENPVMLTALASLHWHRTRLPDQRSELYDSVLEWLARAREEKPERMPARQCLPLMQRLAWRMQSDPKGKQVEISRHAAATALKDRFLAVPEDERLAAAQQFLEEEEIDSGIVVSRGNILRFWHLTFQEYLAARALSSKDEDRRKLLFEQHKLFLPEWRETVLLLAGVLCKQDPERVDAFLGEVLDELGDSAGLAERARAVGLIGRILQDLKSWNYQLADPRYQENMRRMPEIFEPKAAREVDFQTRLEAAEALGQAGDPRLEQDHWVRVEGGAFWMGAQKTNPQGHNYDPEAFDDEAPVHRVEVSPFWMGRYPVTVSEYARFMAQGGHGNVAAPAHWEQQLRYPNRPVVAVSWYEAAAYCAWAGGRLPTEAEWECAARCGREGVRYPWGNDEPGQFRANFGEGGPWQPTPVGLYSEGATPSGIHDLAGNVWEWVRDWFGDYPETAAVNPQGPEQGKVRVLRGGAFLIDARLLRASYRYRNEPGNRNFDVGVRCVRELLSL
jgi:formylglycine-generating enzyme required for sulfatase activity